MTAPRLLVLALLLLSSTAFAQFRADCRFEFSASSYTLCSTEAVLLQAGPLDLSVGVETFNYSTLSPYVKTFVNLEFAYLVGQVYKPLDQHRLDFAFGVGVNFTSPRPLLDLFLSQDEEEGEEAP